MAFVLRSKLSATDAESDVAPGLGGVSNNFFGPDAAPSAPAGLVSPFAAIETTMAGGLGGVQQFGAPSPGELFAALGAVASVHTEIPSGAAQAASDGPAVSCANLLGAPMSPTQGTPGNAGELGNFTNVPDNADQAMNGDVAKTTYGVNGTGIKIGILSTSFNHNQNTFTYSQDVANGDLPQVTIVRDDNSATDDEGRAMAELIHRVAPGAQLFFYTGANSNSDFANGITTLQQTYHCNIIVDDMDRHTLPFYQDGSSVQNAVHNAVAAGVSYFTSAGNSSNKFYESAFHPLTANLPGVGNVTVNDFGGGSPFESIQFNGTGGSILLQWDQPFGSISGAQHAATTSLIVYLYDANGNLITQNTPNANITYETNDTNGDPVQNGNGFNVTGFDPVQNLYFTVPAAGSYKIAVAVNGGSGTPGMFKLLGDHNQVDFVNGHQGSGTVFGHELNLDANVLGAANWHNTPRFGVNPAQAEGFSAYGPGMYLFDKNGNRLASPQILNGITFTATDGNDVSVSNFSPFLGTSAAAPDAAAVAALMMQANLALNHTDITNILKDSALPMASSVNGGAGLIQADVAVQEASNLTFFMDAVRGLLIGTTKSDHFAGGPGSHVIQGGSSGSDFLDYSGAPNTVTVNMTNDTVQNGFGGGDAFSNIKIIYGANVGTVINGGAGSATNEILHGGTGSDLIFGGSAGDTLFGGAGADYFVLNGPAFAAAQAGTPDTIADYDEGNNNSGFYSGAEHDQIDLTALVNGAAFPLGSIVRVVADRSQAYVDLQVDTNGSVGNWITVAHLDNLHLGDTVHVVVDHSNPQGADLPVSGSYGFTGDFNFDGTNDLLFRADNGSLSIWTIVNGQVTSTPGVGNPGPSWHEVGIGDFSARAAAADILFQNDNGTLALWQMNSPSSIGSAPFVGNPGPGWFVAGVQDFDGNGTSDILLQNVNGSLAVWEMNGGHINAAPGLGNPGPSWHVVGTGDFDGNGHADVLLRNDSGDLVIWETDGTKVIATPNLGDPGPSWHVVGTGNFYGRAFKGDILLQNDNGTLAIWEMNGGQILNSPGIGNPGPTWHVAGFGDYNHDGHTDILFRNDNGTLAIWEMNGGQLVGSPGLGNPGIAFDVTTHHNDFV